MGLKEEKESMKIITEQFKLQDDSLKKKIVEEVHEIQENILKARKIVLEDNAKKGKRPEVNSSLFHIFHSR